MHSAIAALGMGVPTAALAYSIKTRGVFATCGQEAHVADARRLSEDEILDIVLRSWDERDKIRAELVDAVPEVIDRAGAQMDVVMERVALIAGQREAACPSHSPQDD
jgi:polysaccharide pyruvyl transferase WcaK-like protein